ncbi:MAG: RMD1 family protein [Pseudomonadota bacterium]
MYIFHAYHLTETLKLKEIDRLFESEALAKSATKLIYKEDDNSYFFIYRFGSIIFFNVDAARRNAVIERIKTVIGEKLEILTSEDFGVEISSDGKIYVGFELASIDTLALDRIELLAFILAQSTALEYFEFKVNEMLGKTGDIGQTLKIRGRLLRKASDIKRFIGQCITTKQNLVASLYLLDKPDETWEDQALDKLYREAVDMFELKDRYKTVDYKLRMIQENLELIAELLQYRHANYLEWAVIILITIEVVLFVIQLFVLEI